MPKLLPLVLIVPALLLASCSSDDGGEPAGVAISTTTTVRTLTADEIDDSTPYCATWKEIRSQGGAQTNGLPEDQAIARRKEYYGRLVPIVTRLLEQATPDIRPEVERALANTEDAAATGSFASFRTAASKAGTQKLAQYALDRCQKQG